MPVSIRAHVRDQWLRTAGGGGHEAESSALGGKTERENSRRTTGERRDGEGRKNKKGRGEQARSHGGARKPPPLEKFEPPPLGCAVPFAVTIGIEVYPPPLEFCQPPPLLTIPGYGAGGGGGKTGSGESKARFPCTRFRACLRAQKSRYSIYIVLYFHVTVSTCE